MLSFLNKLYLTIYLFSLIGCSSFFRGPWKEHPIPSIPVEKAIEIKELYLKDNLLGLKFSDKPIILDEYYVFEDVFLCTLQSCARSRGVWINIYTGKIGTYSEMKLLDKKLK